MAYHVDWQIVTRQWPSSSGSSSPKTVVFFDCLTLKKESEFCLETTVTIYQPTRRHIPKILYFYQHGCDRLKCRSLSFVTLKHCGLLLLDIRAKTVPEFVM